MPSPIFSFTLFTIFLLNKFINFVLFFIFSSFSILSTIVSIKSDICFKNKVFLSSKINPRSSRSSYIVFIILPFGEENISSNFEFSNLNPSNLLAIFDDNRFLNPSWFMKFVNVLNVFRYFGSSSSRGIICFF